MTRLWSVSTCCALSFPGAPLLHAAARGQAPWAGSDGALDGARVRAIFESGRFEGLGERGGLEAWTAQLSRLLREALAARCDPAAAIRQ